MRDRLVIFIGTGCYSGFFPLVPGTFGTFPAWFLVYGLFQYGLPVQIGITAALFVISVWSAHLAEPMFGHDNKKIVIDEWVGMAFATITIPHSLGNYLIALVAFRFFDVVKLPPAAQLERLPGGWGVTMDDVIAGIHANIATWLIILATR